MSQYGIDIVVNPQGAVSGGRTATRSLNDIEKAAGSVTKTLAGLGLAFGVADLAKQLLNVQREFDKLNAGLISATGSANATAQAFEALQDFAASTPYDLAQATEGFIKLVNLGLTPSEKALTSYGDTAAAMGKSLNQMVEAVADAATGEFERLKEFGIKAKSDGDTIAFTFQGVTTSVRNNAAEIESYLIQLGENKFAGTMAERMKTLDGAISNLSDTWDNLLLSVNQLGPNNAATLGVKAISDELQNLTDGLKSGEIPAQIAAFGAQFDATFDDVSFLLSALDTQVTETLNGWGVSAQNSSNFMSDAFWQFPANIRALIQVATVEVAAFVDKASIYGQAIADALNPFSDDDVGFQERMQQRLDGVESARQSTIDGYLAARNAAVKTLGEEQSKAADLRKEYEAQITARKAAAGDRLAGFRVGSDLSTAGPTADEIKKRADSLKKEEQALKANAETVTKLREQLNQASLKGAELAARQAELSLNEYATEQQVGQVRQLATAISDLEAAEKTREEFKQLSQQVEDPLAKLERERMERLAIIQRYEELETSSHAEAELARSEVERQYNDQRMAAMEEVYRQQSWGNELVMNSINALGSASTNVISGLLSGTMSAKEAMQQFANIVLNTVVGSFVQLGVEYIKNQVLASTAQATQLAMAAATGPAIAAAYAPAAAMASLASFGANAAPATAGIASTVATSSALALTGFQSGGYTGDMGVGTVAGVVHGQEYVMNAQATRRIGVDNLERMASGGSMGGGVSVQVYNNAPGVRVQTEQIDENTVRLIINEELDNQFSKRMTGELGDNYSDSNAVLSNRFSISRNTTR